jgi:hypothetical protein
MPSRRPRIRPQRCVSKRAGKRVLGVEVAADRALTVAARFVELIQKAKRQL